MASNLLAMASNLVVMGSTLVAMASNLIAMASNTRRLHLNLGHRFFILALLATKAMLAMEADVDGSHAGVLDLLRRPYLAWADRKVLPGIGSERTCASGRLAGWGPLVPLVRSRSFLCICLANQSRSGCSSSRQEVFPGGLSCDVHIGDLVL